MCWCFTGLLSKYQSTVSWWENNKLAGKDLVQFLPGTWKNFPQIPIQTQSVTLKGVAITNWTTCITERVFLQQQSEIMAISEKDGCFPNAIFWKLSSESMSLISYLNLIYLQLISCSKYADRRYCLKLSCKRVNEICMSGATKAQLQYPSAISAVYYKFYF